MTVDKKDITRIESIDPNPDLSWLGEYTNEVPDPEDLLRGSAFKRNADSREYQYFIPATGVVETVKELQKMGFSRGPSEELARKQCREDYERMEGFGTRWSMVGIQAEIELQIPIGNGSNILQTITSPGVWGVASDCGDTYRDEIFKEEIEVLVRMLTTMGIIVR